MASCTTPVHSRAPTRAGAVSLPLSAARSARPCLRHTTSASRRHAPSSRACRSSACTRQRDNYSFTRYDTLRQTLRPLLLRPVDASTRIARAAWVALMLALQVIACLVPPRRLACWLTTIVASAAVNTICGSLGHNAVHRMEVASVLLDWNGLSAVEWVLEHISSHHMHTNTCHDHDAISMEPIIAWLPGDPASRDPPACTRCS